MTPTVIGYVTLAAVVVSTLTLGVTAAQGRRQNRQYLENRLDAMQGQINALAKSMERILGWLEGQRDKRISSRPDIPPTQ